jgi:hypothetical protein
VAGQLASVLVGILRYVVGHRGSVRLLGVLRFVEGGGSLRSTSDAVAVNLGAPVRLLGGTLARWT